MQIDIDTDTSLPAYQQIVDQIRFMVTSGELQPDQKLPSIRTLASSTGLANNTVVKALRQLEFLGVIKSHDRSGYTVIGDDASRYGLRGVSSDKEEVHNVVDKIDPGVFPGAFCKITEDYLGGNASMCNVTHADGSGTKSTIAYLQYKESGNPSVFRGISQDSIVMNLDDILCVGVTGRILLSNTINRNAKNCPGEVVSALIEGSEEFLEHLRNLGVNIYSGGGETADVGDLTGTLIVDSCATSVLKKSAVIRNQIVPGLAIVGFSSIGNAKYESSINSGVGSNGLTSARHDLLSEYYANKYPETYDENMNADLTYCGPYKLDDPLQNSSMTIGEALLSPTRTYAPIIYSLIRELNDEIKGIIHCSGGGQTKCLKFGKNVHYVKHELFPVPELFAAIQDASGTSSKEMYKVYNMGHRMEVYLPEKHALAAIHAADEFGISAKVIGYTDSSDINRLSLTTTTGKTILY